ERQATERLGRLAALGVLAPDCISSSAYGTEEMLTQLVPWFGLAAFSLVVPVTLAILGVLFFVTLSYFQVINAYTKAGGSYVVARDNFGPKVAQVAAVALLIDYTVTVAVQTSAGTLALASIIPALLPYTVPVTVAVILLLFYGNLRGIREGAKVFAGPTYLYVFALGSVVTVGIVRKVTGTLHVGAYHHVAAMYSLGGHSGLIEFAAVVTVLKSFANGGSSLTGLEAISNGVSAFRRPEGRNASRTLLLMSGALAYLVLGVTLLAHWTRATPYKAGSPTVVSQIVRTVAGHTAVGDVAYTLVLLATVLILFTGANTSFNGFPYLASFVARDHFLPRQLTRRGHRLAFSNGIIVLAVVGLALVIGTGANLNALVALYAIGVFTGFTMAGAGMVVHHRREGRPGWRWRQAINGFAAVLSASVVVIFAVAKFTEGAWLVVVLGPVLYLVLIRLHRQYDTEDSQLEAGAAQACEAPILRHHTVVVLVDRLDLATARALQYARTLSPDQLRAVHFAVDPQVATELEREWRRLGLTRMPLDIIEAPDRRLARAALELAAESTEDGTTELTILLPRRGFGGAWRRVLHDRSADRIAAAVGTLPHVNATIVPFQLSGSWPSRPPKEKAPAEGAAGARRDRDEPASVEVAGTVPVGEAIWRSRVRVAGRVRQVRVPTQADVANLECTLVDPTGRILLVFQGRRRVPGIQQGARLVAQGTVGAWRGQLAILNPDYELLAGPDTEPADVTS
ncbi:MAG: amino acid permease, partial [Acidobacteriota bacterium]|nr:amino acid permease [Acidobacteriota bacterium]